MTVASAQQWLRFRLQDTQYAIPLEAVAEVTAPKRPNLIPLVPLDVGGILNVRGEPLPAVDGCALVGASSGGATAPRPALILEDGKIRVGVLVDSVSRIERGLAESGPDEMFEDEPAPKLAFVEWVRIGGERVGLVDAQGWLGLAIELLTKQGGHRGEEACPSGF
ncbi:MAG: CheW domain-containing protein [Deltaproteobacteria bacterium]|nr:CheW domain-containing protein [Deltaproteobacteria bacterium]MBW2414696.1 CheW domain-containing protein [Deltaproteobacteria bacterium]